MQMQGSKNRLHSDPARNPLHQSSFPVSSTSDGAVAFRLFTSTVLRCHSNHRHPPSFSLDFASLSANHETGSTYSSCSESTSLNLNLYDYFTSSHCCAFRFGSDSQRLDVVRRACGSDASRKQGKVGRDWDPVMASTDFLPSSQLLTFVHDQTRHPPTCILQETRKPPYRLFPSL